MTDHPDLQARGGLQDLKDPLDFQAPKALPGRQGKMVYLDTQGSEGKPVSRGKPALPVLQVWLGHRVPQEKPAHLGNVVTQDLLGLQGSRAFLVRLAKKA